MVKSQFDHSMRTRSVVLLHTFELSDPASLWLKYRDDVSEVLKYQVQLLFPNMEVGFSDEFCNRAFTDIEDKIVSMGGNTLPTYGLPRSMSIPQTL